MSILYGISTYFHRHQGSHLVHIKSGEVTLNPILVFILWSYNITFLPWLFLIFIGFKTTWYLPLIVLGLSQAISLSLVSIEMKLNYKNNGIINGALVSILGIIVVPLTLIPLLFLFPNVLTN
jgi:hypothetical protein